MAGGDNIQTDIANTKFLSFGILIMVFKQKSPFNSVFKKLVWNNRQINTHTDIAGHRLENNSE